MNHHKSILILLAVGYFFLMCGNGLISLTHPDEVFYTQTAKEMLARKSWMTPTIFDQPQFEKPILFYWLLASAIKWFGITPFTARFWPAFFGIFGLIVTYWISWMLFKSKQISLLSGVILGTCFIYVALSRAVLTDMVFSIWVILSLGFFYYGYHEKKHKAEGIVLCFVFSGLAVLTKGLLGLCFPWVIIVGYLLAKRDIGFLRCRASLWGGVLLAVITVPWHLLMIHWYGQDFIKEYFENVHIRRLFEAEHLKCNTWYFYFMTMFGGLMPWSFFLFPALGRLYQDIRKRAEGRWPLLFLVFWILGILLMVQPAQSKLASYIFPAFPALAILLAYHMVSVLQDKQNVSERGMRIAGYLLSGTLIAAVFAAVFFARKYSDIIINLTLVYIFAFIILLCAMTIFFLAYHRKIRFLLCAVPTITFSLFILFFFGKSYAEPWVSCRQISEIFKELDSSDSVVLASKFYVRGVRFYTDREMAVIDIVGKNFFSHHPIPFLTNDEVVLDLLKKQPQTFGVVKDSSLHDLERIVEKGKYAMTHFAEIGGKHIIKIE